MRIIDWEKKGFSIREAKTDLTTFVSKEDYEAGVPLSFTKCAVANSLRRLVPGLLYVSVQQHVTYIAFKGKKILRYINSSAVETLAKLQDIEFGGEIRGVTVTLTAPPKSRTRKVLSERARKAEARKVEFLAGGGKWETRKVNKRSSSSATRRSNGLNAEME